MFIGVRAHDFGKSNVEELAEKISAKGFTSIQLALSKAIQGIDTGYNRLSPGLARYIGNTLARHNIQIAILGCYINPIHPDPETRQNSLGRFKEHLRYARDFGCSIVGTETGSINADCSYHPKNDDPETFRQITQSISQLVAEAEKFGVIVGVEAVTTHTISNTAKMRMLIDAIQSNNLQVIFDPVNLLDPVNYQTQDGIIQSAFDLFGDRIVLLHAKDFVIENGQKKIVPPGEGLLHYEYLLKLLKTYKPYVNISLEDNRPETMLQSVSYIEKIYNDI
jgi:sugar phosphate isomerase/epimerase